MSKPLRYLSTRGRSPAATISGAIAAGLAPDGSLYVPEALPRLDAASFAPHGSLADTAATLLAPFFAGDPLSAGLPAICREALDFETPLRPLPQRDAFVLELFHGPTAAFKDVGARFLAACLRRLPRQDARPLTILVATSGDTGAAVGAAFHGQPNIEVVILYPDGRVSPRQAHQLGSFGGNVRTLRIQGRFDDCQRMVKAALNDAALQAVRPLSSANSISLGRLLPQMSYYTHAALGWWHTHRKPLNFIVPTGNLGNALAALWVRKIGLPVGKVYLACNANTTLPEFFHGGDYRPRDAVATLANAMDVGAPSNFERLRWTFGNDDASLRHAVHAVSVDDARIRHTIAHHASTDREVFCPHTATAIHVLDSLRKAGDTVPWAVVATAHPAKFGGVVEPLIGRSVSVPAALAAMLDRPAEAEPMAAEDEALKRWLRESLPEPRNGAVSPPGHLDVHTSTDRA
ncbi:MAG: threonine synthase [Rhodanobacteraceae bacterium]